MTTIKLKITESLTTALTPTQLEVTDESFMHHVPKGAESHFKIVVVSEKFKGKMLLARHRLVNEALGEIQGMVKAISLHTLTPEEWSKREAESRRSPTCQGQDEA